MLDRKVFSRDFDQALRSWFDERQSQFAASAGDEIASDVLTPARDVLFSGGKRIRPYIAYLMYHGISGEQDIPEPLFGLELFHTFALIHDDIIDKGLVRHGVPTLHRQLAKNGPLSKHDPAHIGHSQALLVGDLLFSWANECFDHAPDDVREATMRQFRTMVDEVVAGQMIDVDLMAMPKTSEDRIIQKMFLKTASYTFIRPMQVGTVLARANGKCLAFCDAFGRELGIGFQIQDDLFDLIATESQMHKTPFSDLKDRQLTLFTQYITDRGSKEEKKELEDMLGTYVTESDRERITSLFDRSGSFAYGRQMMNDCFDRAKILLDECTLLPAEAIESLRVLLTYIRDRHD